MLKFAMLSAWHVHAEGYAHEINAHPETEVALVWDDDPVRGEAFARKLGVPFEPSLEKALQDENIDAVCVNTATTMHLEVITAAAVITSRCMVVAVFTQTASMFSSWRAFSRLGSKGTPSLRANASPRTGSSSHTRATSVSGCALISWA